MIRLLGAITGSALALAALLLLVGIPQFKTQNADVERQSLTLPLPSAPVEEISAPAPAKTDNTTEEGQNSADDFLVPETADLPAAVADKPVKHETDAADIWDIPVLEEPPPEQIRPVQIADDSTEHTDAIPQWYAFWSPFRSELAASGFITQLQRVTGLDYRVVKIKPGVYEVAFAYDDDQEIPLNLTQITAATGLQLPEG